jgi:hypothetical protein
MKPDLPSRRVVVTGLAVLVGSFALGAVALSSARGSRVSERPAEARAKGALVRHAVDQAPKNFPVGARSDWRDISALVAPYIPAGMSYDVAEEILWHAGFGLTWSRRTAARPMDENLKRCLTLAIMRRLTLWPVGEFEVSVTLVPDRRTHFDTVERTSAFIRGERWI